MLELDSENFDAEINADVPVVVDFWAPWCGPCRSQAPILEQFAAFYGDKVKVCKVNTDQSEELCRRFSVMSIPTIAVFCGGTLTARAVGVQSLEALRNLAGL